MSIKLIVADMDGTLLNEKLEISKRTQNAILSAQNAGIEFIIATGRTLNSGYSIVKKKGINCPYIELNGARLFDEHKKIQFTHEISKLDLAKLVEIIVDNKIQSIFITQDGAYSIDSLKEHVLSYEKIFKDINKSITKEDKKKHAINHVDKYKISQVKNYTFLQENSKIQVLKVILNTHQDPMVLDDIKETIEQNISSLLVTSGSNFNIEINDHQANKGRAVSEYAKKKGYRPEEVITIGDGFNDISMLEWATHSYAVENAHKLVKKAATYSAPNHEDDAVAKIIEKVLAGEKLCFNLKHSASRK